jgi:F0F1-type ATP synthase assembly protein I
MSKEKELEKKSKKNNSDYNKTNLQIFGIISSWIVAPIVGALLLGSWLDEKYNHENFFTLTFIAVAFIITCVGIVKEALKAIKSLE